MKDWRLARSLALLFDQVNAAYPHRSKAWDGSLGDEAHAARKSDHNPDEHGIVHAIDITHDPKGGCDAYALAETLRKSRDPRISYVISNGRKFSSTISPWKWRPYTGENKHDHHTHVSVTTSGADDVTAWRVDTAAVR